MKVNLISLGCAKNLYDSEMILGLLKTKGYQITPFKDKADLIIINTCGFIEPAKKEAINTIFDVVSNKKEHQKVIVVGCLSTRYKEDLIKEIPEVDKFVSIKEYNNLNNIIDEVMNKPLSSYSLDFHNRVLATSCYSANVRIGDGCDNNCTYCAIPLIRGGFNSRSIEDIYEECEELIQKGIQELVLIAQDTTRFGKETGERIEDLLIKLDTLDVKMIRLLYLYPDEISDELVDIIANSKHICHYFDIPIQHASNKILKKMNRRGTKEDLDRIYNKIRSTMNDAIIRTTVMVGFPYEEEEDFDELVDFIKEHPFDRLGAFTYSKEEDTKAFDMPQVDEKIKQKRFDKLMQTQMFIASKLSEDKIGNIYEVFIDGYDFDRKEYMARSYGFSGDGDDGFIYIKSKSILKVGTICKVKIVSADMYDLEGEIIN